MRTVAWVAMLSKSMFHTGREKFFMQSEFIGSRWITEIVRHSNEAGDSASGT